MFASVGAAGQVPPNDGMAADRFARAAIRVALRQLQEVGKFTGAGGLAGGFDRPDEPNDATDEHPCTA